MSDLKVHGMQKLLKDLKVIEKNVIKAVDAGIWETAQDIRDDAVRNITNNKSVFTGELRRSIDVKKQGDKVLVGALSEKVPISRFVEYGTKPHFPPFGEDSPLYAWVKAKIGGNVKQMTFMIARKISKVGTTGKPFLGPAYHKNIGKLYKNVRKFINKYVK
jgi:HK97 gp10 family phage protein